MIELFWSILNITILLFFLYLFIGFLFKGKKIFEGRFKNLSIAILILGVINMVSANDSDKFDNTINIDNKYNQENYEQASKLILEDNLTMNINLSIMYSKENKILIPIKATSNLSGFVSGFEWQIKSVHTTSKTNKEKKDFTAYGILEWKLFGIKIYSQEKSFKGII